MSALLQEHLDKLAAVQSERGLIKCITQYLACKDIEKFALRMYVMAPNVEDSISFYHAPKSMKSWIEYREEQGYYRLDSWLVEAYREGIPVYWKYDPKGLRGEHKQFHQDGLDAGIHDGLDFPAHAVGNSYGCLTICNLSRASQRDPKGAYAQEVWSYFAYFYARFRELYAPVPKKSPSTQLSERQLQCLQLTSNGHGVEAIAKKLGITSSTVNFHIQKAIKELGVQNKYQAIMLLHEPT